MIQSEVFIAITRSGRGELADNNCVYFFEAFDESTSFVDLHYIIIDHISVFFCYYYILTPSPSEKVFCYAILWYVNISDR